MSDSQYQNNKYSEILIIFAIVAAYVAALHFTVAVAVAPLKSCGCSGSVRYIS